MVTERKVSALAGEYGLTDVDLLAMYRLVALARSIDERLWVLNRAGRIPFVISGQGHEGAQVGVTYPMRHGTDWLCPYYRSIAACMTAGMSARDIVTAQYATANDPSSGGRQMPGHYAHADYNILSVSSPVATQILHAAGIALAARIRHTDQVAMAYMGEGSSNQGDVHEALNFVGIHKLPMILIVENNGYAISVPASKESAVEDIAVRAAGYAMPGVVVDGTDVLACYRVAREAIERARAGEGGTLIEAKVTRLTAHSSDDQQTKYRSAEELEAEKARDPLPRFRAQLQDAGVLTDARLEAISADVATTVDEATQYAEAEPDPDPATATWWVYHEDGPADWIAPWKREHRAD